MVHSEKFKLDANCLVVTNEHRIQTSHDFNVEPIAHAWPQNWNMSNMLFDLDPLVLCAQVHELHLYTHAPTTARNLKKLLNSTAGATGMWVATVFLVLEAAIFLCLLGYLGYQYLMIQKAQKANAIQGEQA